MDNEIALETMKFSLQNLEFVELLFLLEKAKKLKAARSQIWSHCAVLAKAELGSWDHRDEDVN